jgi:deoxycytidylate deaminase
LIKVIYKKKINKELRIVPELYRKKVYCQTFFCKPKKEITKIWNTEITTIFFSKKYQMEKGSDFFKTEKIQK